MKICVLSAVEFESKPIAKAFNLRGPISYGFTSSWTGKPFTLVQTNIGKVHAAAVTQYVIDRDKPDWIINVGVSGGFAKKVSLGDVVMPTAVVQYDLDQTKLGYPLGRIHKIEKIKLPLQRAKLKAYPLKFGLCLTADKILSDKKEGRALYLKFHPIVVDMELGSIAQVCFLNNTRLLAFKSPIDIVEKEEIASFTLRIDLCMSHLIQAFRGLIPSLENKQ